jgi:prophage tail gpP-like protein
MPFPSSEIAILNVGGMQYRDWESVSVRWAMSTKESPPYTFRFTCSEAIPIPPTFAGMQIRPGDSCSVTLAGNLAITGKVTTRQVFYDANRHYVEIQGATSAFNMGVNSTVPPGHEYFNKAVPAIAQDIVKQSGNSLVVKGGSLPNHIFNRFNIPFGESNLDSLQRLLKSFGVLLTSNEMGNVVAIAGPFGGGGPAVIEGVNILEGREIIYNPTYGTEVPVATQQTGHKDTGFGAAVASMPFTQQKLGLQGINWNAMMGLVAEVPGIKGIIPQGRGAMENAMQSGDQITVFATVYGWTPGADKGRGGGPLWPPPGANVYVKSPSLIMDTSLIVKSVTFLQDNQIGTRTILELCNQAALSGGTPQAGAG